MALSQDPEKRARQLANLAKSNPAVRDRLERDGNKPAPPAPTKPKRQAMRVAPPPAHPKRRKAQDAPEATEPRSRRRARDDDEPRRGGGFFRGLFDV